MRDTYVSESGWYHELYARPLSVWTWGGFLIGLYTKNYMEVLKWKRDLKSSYSEKDLEIIICHISICLVVL